MTLERSDRVYAMLHQASEKYDYFVAGASLALVSYLSANLHPIRLGWNPGTLEIAATVAILGGVVCAFKRIETILVFLRVMHAWLHGEEAGGALTKVATEGSTVLNVSTGEFLDPRTAASEARHAALEVETATALLESLQATVGRWFRMRDRCLLFGLFLLIAARAWSAYEPMHGRG